MFEKVRTKKVQWLGISAIAVSVLVSMIAACTLEPDLSDIKKDIIKANPYTITFDVTGGAEGGIVVPSPPVPKGSLIPMPDPLDHTNPYADYLDNSGNTHYFGWWFNKDPSTSPAGLAPWDFQNNKVTGKTTLYAGWNDEVNPGVAIHTVVFFANNSKASFTGGAAFAYDTVTNGDTVELIEPSPPARADYYFAGWYTDAACTDANIWDVTSDTVDHSLALYAKWKPNLVSITITHQPTKTDYSPGDTLDLGGLVVTANYKDKSTAIIPYTDDPSVTPGYTTVPADGATLLSSDTSVTVSYTEDSVTADPRTITLTMNLPPAEEPVIDIHDGAYAMDDASYEKDDTAAALKVVVPDPSDGGTLSYQWYKMIGASANPATDTAIANEDTDTFTPPTDTVGTFKYYVKVTNSLTDYADTSVTSVVVTITVTAAGVTLDHISITGPSNTTYVEGQLLDLTGLVVTASYSDGSSAEVGGYTTTPSISDALTTSDTSVTVSYTDGSGTKTDTFAITVVAKVLDSISLSGSYKTSYYVDDYLDLGGLVVTANYNDGSTVPVLSGSYTTDPDTSTALATTDTNVTVSYNDGTTTKTAQYTIAVIPLGVTLDHITVAGPTNTTYVEGQHLDLTGLVVTAFYSDNSSGPVGGYTTSPSITDILTTSDNLVTVSYTLGSDTETDTFAITVDAKTLTSISLSGTYQTSYVEGAYLNLSGLVVTANYNDSSTVTVPSGSYTTSPTTSAALATTDSTVTVSYDDGTTIKTAQYTITVDAKTLTGISLSGPSKTAYHVGDNLDLSDLTVTANYNDGSTVPVPSGSYTTDPDTSTALATTDTLVTVSYTDGITKTATFAITVTAVFTPVTDITITGTLEFAVDASGDLSTPLDLSTFSPTVVPSGATNQTIAWSIVGTWPGISVSGDTIEASGYTVLNPTTGDEVTVRATIANGLAAGTVYTKDFTLTVNAPASAEPPLVLSDITDLNPNGLLISLSYNDEGNITATLTGTVDNGFVTSSEIETTFQPGLFNTTNADEGYSYLTLTGLYDTASTSIRIVQKNMSLNLYNSVNTSEIYDFGLDTVYKDKTYSSGAIDPEYNILLWNGVPSVDRVITLIVTEDGGTAKTYTIDWSGLIITTP